MSDYLTRLCISKILLEKRMGPGWDSVRKTWGKGLDRRHILWQIEISFMEELSTSYKI